MRCRSGWYAAGLWLAALSIVVTSAAAEQPRPFLFGVGRYTAAWAGRPWSYDQQCWDHMANIGATVTGSGLCWCDGESTAGVYDQNAWDYADFEVDNILARGMEPHFFLGLTPQWAKLYPDLPPHRTPAREDCVDEFMSFHYDVAEHFRGRVKYYFFWNEPNGCSWINDGCSNMDGYPLYTQWLIRCSQAVKAADPDAKIIAGRLDYHSGVTHGYEYVQGMYDHGAGPYIDGISIHPYGSPLHWQAILDTRAVMVANGDEDKPIWVMEYGWNTGNEQEKAANLSAVLTELKKPEWHYVQLANYLVLNDGGSVENYGLTDAELNPRTAYWTFKNFDKTWPDYAEFSADVTTGPSPLTVHFADESVVSGAHTWYWEFGDGETSYDEDPTHVYEDGGAYTVSLTVTGTNGPCSEEKTDYIRVGYFPPEAGPDNPSFEDGGGSYFGWDILRVAGEEGPNEPPLSNYNAYGLNTPFGTHFGGRCANDWNKFDFTLGQVIGTENWDPAATRAEWQLSAHVQLHCSQSNFAWPAVIHQVWEIGWNDNGQEPVGIDSCDNWQVIAELDGNFTGNDRYNFYPISLSGSIEGPVGLRGVALRVGCYNDAQREWSMSNFDNLSFQLSSVPSAPDGSFRAGWNLISLPVSPIDPEPSAALADLVDMGNAVAGSLHAYDSVVGYLTYPADFASVDLGCGYWLHLSTVTPGADVEVPGAVATECVQLSLADGWNLIGDPFVLPIPWGDCELSDGGSTKSAAEAAAAGWIDGSTYCYVDGSYSIVRCGGTADDDSLRPWRGYWLLALRPGLSLIVPTPFSQ